MEREIGDRDFPIWLLGDSEPERWRSRLATPLDPRHPIRHNIWTSMLDVIQERVFRESRSRVDTASLYIRNAIADAKLKPHNNALEWDAPVQAAVGELGQLLKDHHPKLVLCFGAFSFEFARRALGQEPQRPYGYWGARRLGEAFRNRMAAFDPATLAS